MGILVASLIDAGKLQSDKRNDGQLADVDWVTMTNWAVKSLWRLLSSLDPDFSFTQLDFTLLGGTTGATLDLNVASQIPLLPSAIQAHNPSPIAVTANGSSDGIVGTTLGLGSIVFLPTDVGCQVVIAGATNSNNNGTFTIQTFQSGATVVLSGAHTTEVFPPTATITLVRQIGAAFRALHGIEYQPDTTGRRTVLRRNFRERNQGRIGWWLPGLPCGDRKYDLRGLILNITPYELAAGPYRAYYRYAPYLFTSPVDTTPLDPQLEAYDEYLSVMAAMKALGIEESSQDPMAMRLSEMVQEITDEHERDDEAAAVIADVEDDDGSWGSR